MFCPFCGTQLPDDSRFCSGCGSRLDFDDNVQEYTQEMPVMPEIPEDPYGKKPGKGKVILLIAILVIVLAGSGIGGFMVWNHVQESKEEEEEREAELAEAEEEKTNDSKETKSGSANKAESDSKDEGTSKDGDLEDSDKSKDADSKNTDKNAEESTEKNKSQDAEEKKVEAKYDSTEGGIHRYEYIVADKTWEQAYADCISRGGYMVRINSLEEYNYILNEISQKQLGKIQFFIGGRRMSGSQEYYWVDENGEPYGDQINASSYWCSSEWLSGEPSFKDGSTEEMYLDILYHEGSGKWVWNDAPNDIISIVPSFSGKIGYICEYEN